jgi:hypothetical protein
MKRRHWYWAVLGTVVIALVIFAPADDDGKAARPIRQATPAASVAKRPAEVGRVELERLDRAANTPSEVQGKVGNAFNITSWYVPPPAPHRAPAPVVVAPPPVVVPTAPPLPFAYLGRYGDTASRIVILTKGDRVYTVSVGDVIENTYRLEKLTPGMVYMTHLPTSTEQVLRTGETL